MRHRMMNKCASLSEDVCYAILGDSFAIWWSRGHEVKRRVCKHCFYDRMSTLRTYTVRYLFRIQQKMLHESAKVLLCL